MGQYAVSNDAVAAVVAAPGFSLSLAPLRVEVGEGDLDMVCRFTVDIVREVGYDKPVYLLVAGTSIGEFKVLGQSIMVPDGAGGFKDYGLVPAIVSHVDLEMDLGGMNIIDIPFAVQGFEDEPIA